MSQNASILVVDDDPQWLHSLSHVLGGAGYEVRQAASGEDTLASLAGGAPDLILLDIRMPDMDGFEVFRRIREHEEWRGIPIIMLSGVVEAKERAAGIEMGASDFITKPFDSGELLARVGMQLEMARLRAGQVRHAEDLEAANNALRESERDYRLLFEGMLDGFALHEILCDESGKPVDCRFVSINPAFEELTGIRAAEAVGKTVREILPGIEDVWIERYGRVALTGAPIQFEEYFEPLGKVFHITAYCPHLGQFAVVFEDITGRKAAEARIARLTQLYAALSQCNQAIVHSSSVEELLPEICRVAVEFGGMKMAWIGMLDETTGEIRPAAAFGSGTEYLKEFRFTTDIGEPAGCAPMGTALRENTPVWCQDFQNDPRTAAWAERGALFGWAAVAALPLRLDGKPVGGFSIYSDQVDAFDEEARKLLEEMAYDISFALDAFRRDEERRRAEELLENSLQILQAAMDNSQAGIAIADAPDGLLRYVNKAGLLIVGLSEEEATRGIGINQYASSWHLTDLDGRPLPPEEVPLARALLFGEICTGKFKVHKPDNGCRIVMANAAPIFDSGGKVKAGIVVFLDITESEQLSIKAEAAALAKSEFFAIISHELRTPLNGVLGFTELLGDTPLADEQKSFVQTISSSGNHLLAIVNDILDFSSIEKGALAIRSEPFATDDLLDSAVSAASQDAGEKGLEFRCEKKPGVSDYITGDERRIRQIILNLLNNAVKFTSAGSVILRVSPASDGDLRFLDFSVEDTGIGISPDSISRLFQPFVQADSTMHRKFGGTGLGLVISKRIAEAMGGSVTVVSSPGKGSTFTFRLPLTPAESGSGILPVRRDEPGGGTPLHQECNPVLVVDDDRDSRMLAAKMLQHLGRSAELAADGAGALRAFAPGKYSAILMDMAMPVMDGLEATRKIREAEAVAGSHVPIIALTANVMPGDRERCLAAGMDDFLSKPFQKAQLAALLGRVAKLR